jgi:hypothetical protein
MRRVVRGDARDAPGDVGHRHGMALRVGVPLHIDQPASHDINLGIAPARAKGSGTEVVELWLSLLHALLECFAYPFRVGK